MPCNLAVSITKAAVTDEHLNELLVPDVLERLARAYLESEGYAASESLSYPNAGEFSLSRMYGNEIILTVCPAKQDRAYPERFSLFLVGGRVTGRGQRGPLAAQMDAMVAAFEQLLRETANSLLAQEIADALAVFGAVQQQQVSVDEGGQIKMATVVTLNL